MADSILLDAAHEMEMANRDRVMDLMAYNPILEKIFNSLPRPKNLEFIDLLLDFCKLPVSEKKVDEPIFAEAEGRN
ncbi:MAG: hypothetical protein KGI54_17655 [Pseudomonadota bacterium]|nr:hypothetical protein [Pseudomonadota bacterium]